MTDPDLQKNTDLKKGTGRTNGTQPPIGAELQTEPIQEGSFDASRQEKITGLLNQIAADLAQHPHEEISAQVRLRLSEAGILADDDEIESLTRTIMAAR